MKFLILLLLVSLAAQAQRSMLVTEMSVESIRDVNLNPREDSGQRTATVIVHVRDKDFKPYVGFLFKVQYRDLDSGLWLTHKRMEIVADVDTGHRGMIVLKEIPAGYYRAWAECLRTETVGTEPMIIKLTKKNDGSGPRQFTLQIPQRQYWSKDYEVRKGNQF